MHPVRFELTPPKRIELESTALDHSAMNAPFIYKNKKYLFIAYCASQLRDLNSRPSAYEADAITTMLSWQRYLNN
jgi:hypothetical protein